MDKTTIKALCVGYICAAIALAASYAIPLLLATSVIIILIAGGAPTLYMLNR